MMELFSSREISTAIWTLVVFILILIMAIKSIKLRNSIYHLIKTAINKYIIIFLCITILYATFWIILLSNLAIWDWDFLKDVILWVLFIGIPICFNAITERDQVYFRDLVRRNFTFAIFIEFLVGTFTFSIVVELFLVPIATLLTLLYIVSKIDESYKQAEKLFSFLLTTLGFIVLFYAGRNALQNFLELNVLGLLITFSLPITMTFAFLPLSYSFALYSEYEILFIKLKFRLPKKRIRKKYKWRILKACNFSLNKVQFFHEKYLMQIYSTMEEKDIDGIIDKFNLSYKKQLAQFILGLKDKLPLKYHLMKGEKTLSLEDSKSLNSYSLVLAFLSIGFISILFEPFNNTEKINVSMVVGGVIIFIALTGLTIQINNILKVEGKYNVRISDLGVALFLTGVIYLSWKLLSYIDWINNYTITSLMFIALVTSFGFFRGFILILKNVFLATRSNILGLLLRVIPILISIIALFSKFKNVL